MQASSQDHPFEGQDAPCSPESEATVATEDLPHTADWVALRQRQASQLQSLSVSSSFDSQDTVLTADLPDTNDWLRLRKFRDTRTSNDTTTRAQKEEAKSSPPKGSKPSTVTLGPNKVTPPGQGERNQQTPETGTKTRDRAEPESDSEATTWSFDENDVHRRQRENANRHTASNSKIMNPNHHSRKNAQLKSDPISPLTQQDCAQGYKSNGIQSSSQRRTIITKKTTVTNHNSTVSSPLLFPRKRRQLPQSPADSIASYPLFSTRIIIKTLRPQSSMVASKSNSDSDATTTTTTTPSPPQKQQKPWFQKKTKKRKLQQVRLTFG